MAITTNEMVLVSVALVLVVAGLGWHFYRLIQGASQRMASKLTGAMTDIETTLDEKLRPRILVFDSADTVAERAAELILAAAAEETPSDRWATFYGAASLAARGDDSLAEAEGVYSRALDEASREKVLIKRYVSLFTEAELLQRGDEVRARYLAWIEKQLQYLSNDELYRIENIKRAPKWGANMARILTKQAVMEVTGNGTAAVVIEDAKTANIIRGFARKAVLGGANKVEVFGQSRGQESIAELRERFESLSKAAAEHTFSGEDEA